MVVLREIERKSEVKIEIYGGENDVEVKGGLV